MLSAFSSSKALLQVVVSFRSGHEALLHNREFLLSQAEAMLRAANSPSSSPDSVPFFKELKNQVSAHTLACYLLPASASSSLQVARA